MGRRWVAILAPVAWMLLVCVLAGLIIGHMLLFMLLGVSLLLTWHLIRLYRLHAWVEDGLHSPPPTQEDVWLALHQRFSRLRQRGRKRKRKLSRFIKQFRDATGAVPNAVVVLSDDNEVLWLNPVAERLLGLRSPQDIGLQITHLVRHPTFVGFLNQERFEDSVELPSPTNDEVLLSVHITPYGKRRRLMLVEDITQVRRLEQMRRDFVANVSHELRTPLTVINGYLETFLDSGDDCCRPWRQPMHRMHEQTERMLNLIEDLLILSRLETDGAQRHEHPVPVPELLHSVAEDAINLSAQSGHEIRVEADSELWLLGCESELRSAFSNLVFNAVRHTPNRGEVVISWHADHDGLHLEVQDDGEGIPATHIPRLTERFYRIDRGRSRNCGGTGLGLAIVKHVLNRHDGRLRITSEVGVGSTFSCDFPVQRRLQRELASAANQ